jgi:chorismate dehydratase
MNPVRLGAVEYLNARPLVFRLDACPRFVLRFDWPSRCAALLHDNAIDVGLIPSIEYLRAPSSATGPQAYRIVPDLAVASRGPVASVALYTTKPITTKPIADVESIALDTSSRTSVALTRVLSARVFRIRPELRACEPDLEAMLAGCDAALIIGDKALLMNGGTVHRGDRELAVEKIDLGEVWTRETGLPFVYAFWTGRSGVLRDADVSVLQHARDVAVRELETVAAEYFADTPEVSALGARYLRDNIHYQFGPDEKAGLELFYRYAAEAGVVPGAETLRFF